MRGFLRVCLGVVLVILVVGSAGLAARAETRIALVITNQAYPDEIGRLANPHRDGALIIAALKKAGFEDMNIVAVRDADQAAMRQAIADLIEKVELAGPDTVVFLYYSGHGAADRTERGENYLIPTGARITLARQLPIQGVSLTEITKSLERVRAKARFVVIDACRNVAFTKGLKDAAKGFVPERRLDGIIVAFATRPGETAEDNSSYATALSEILPTPGLLAEQVFKATQRRVAELSRGTQVPWTEDGLLTEFRFRPAAASAATDQTAAVSPAAPPSQPAAAAAPPRCTGVEIEVAGSGKRCLNPKDTFEDCFTTGGKRICGPKMVVIPPGRFLMGTSDAEIEALIKEYPKTSADWFRWEAPQREVSIPRAFAAGETHITRGQFGAFVRATGHKTDGGCHTYDGKEWKLQADKSWRDPGFAQDDSHPAVCINWNDAQAYVAWIKQQTGVPYRLLSEAEAEYVARGMTWATPNTRYFFGNDSKVLCRYGNGADLTAAAKFDWNTTAVAQCRDEFVYTAPAGRFGANPFGLKDVHGSVLSWTEDCFVDNYRDAPRDGSARTSGGCSSRVLRGGSWLSGPQDLRSAVRSSFQPGFRFIIIGFRLARTLNP